MKIDIRQAVEANFPTLQIMWQSAGFFYPPWDNEESLKRKIKLQPDLFLVAILGEQVVGGVIGTYDGWAAYINHLAIDSNYFNHEIEKMLLIAIEDALKKRGAKTVFVLTMPGGWETHFYPLQGFTEWGVSRGFEKSL